MFHKIFYTPNKQKVLTKAEKPFNLAFLLLITTRKIINDLEKSRNNR